MDFYASSAHRALNLRETFRNSPRFGYTNQFSDVFNEDQAPGYVIGIVITALILVSAFLCWGIFLLILKCMGTNRVGFLSGSPYQAKINGEPSKRPVTGRIVFGCSGLVFITFTLVLLFVGFGNLESTTDDMSDGVFLGKDLLTDSGKLLERFLGVAADARNLRDGVVEAIEDIFETANMTQLPSVENVTLLANRTLPPALGDTATAAKFIFGDINLQEEAVKVVESLNSLAAIVKGPTEDLSNLVTKGETTMTDVSTGLDSVELRGLQIGFGIPFTILPFVMLLLMGATAMGYNSNMKNCLTSWLMVPIFIFFLLFMIILTMGFSIGGIVNADFCMGGAPKTPDATLIMIMDEKGISPRTLEYRSVSYLVNGCDFETNEDENPLIVYQNIAVQLDNITSVIQGFDAKLQEIGIVEIVKKVAKDVSGVEDKLEAFKEETVSMFGIMEEILSEIACARLFEIYDKFVNDAACGSSYKGLFWSFLSLLTMSASGFLMLTFRAVLYPLAGDDNDDDNSWNRAKENEAQQEVAPMTGNDDDDGEHKGYTVTTGLADSNKAPKSAIDEEPPLGGTAAAPDYESNPFEEEAEA